MYYTIFVQISLIEEKYFNLSKVPVYLVFCDRAGVDDPIQYESGGNSSEIRIPFHLFHLRGIDTFVIQGGPIKRDAGNGARANFLIYN